MGIPTNSTKGQGCNPVSSNCVIWQGKDIPCINICNGDSVTDVVFKLATELCTILDTLDIDTYDIDCFKPICPDPQNFHDLIQFLITKVCELQCCCDNAANCTCKDCPDDCIVTIAPCFYFQNQVGDTITTMSLTEYTAAIGNKVCQIAGSISTQDARIQTLDIDQIAQGERLTAVEAEVAASPSTVGTSCLLGPPPPGGWPIVTVLTNLENEVCNLETATGTPIEILQSVQKQCANMDSLKTLTNRNNTYSGITGWVPAAEYNTLADAVNNMWLSICDMRSAVENILATCCCTDCDDVDISFTAILSAPDAVTLFFTGSIPTGLTDCFPNGNLITITDGDGASYVTYVQVVNNINAPGVVISLTGTPINSATDLTISIQGCWNRPSAGSDCGGLRCERILTYLIINTAPCPPLVIIPTIETAEYSFTNNVSGPITYTVELYTGAGVFVTSDTHVNPALAALVAGTFAGLTGDTGYYISVKVIINGVTKVCPQAFFNTLPYPCAAPTAVSAATP